MNTLIGITIKFYYPVNQSGKGSYHLYTVDNAEQATQLKLKYLKLKSDTLSCQEIYYRALTADTMSLCMTNYQSTKLFDDYGFVKVSELYGTKKSNFRLQYTGGLKKPQCRYVSLQDVTPDRISMDDIDPMSMVD